MTMSEVEGRLQRIEKALKELIITIKTRNDEIDKKLDHVLKSQEFISQQYDDLKKLTDNLMKANVNLKGKKMRS